MMSGMKTILIPLAEGFEEIEAVTMIDVLRRANFNVTTASLDGTNLLVKGAHGISIKADELLKKFDNHLFDVICLPGGMPGTTNLLDSLLISEMLKLHNNENKIVAAICAAPWVLFEAGVLNGKSATCYLGFEEKLVGVDVQQNNVVVDENIITSRGAGTALEFSLTIVEKLLGQQKAQKLSEQMIYSMYE